MRKTIISVVVFTLLLSQAFIFASFPDTKNHWASKDIETLVGTGVINGYKDGQFKPDNTITGGEFIKLLVTIKALTVTPVSGHWSQPYVQAAEKNGYMPAGMLADLDAPIKREHMALLIANAATKVTAYPYAYLNYFKDISTVFDPFQKAILVAYGSGIVGGYEDQTFRPQASATRAEAVTMLVRMTTITRRQARTLVFTKATLAMYNGQNGNAALVALSGKVYDVSLIPQWKSGKHYLGITAGVDLTANISKSPHGASIVSKAVLVGTYR